MELTVAHALLTDDAPTRARDLARYFGQLTVQSNRQPAGWQLKLSRSVAASSYLDPELSEGLQWWSRTFGPVNVESICAAVYQDDAVQIALEDSWTLYVWSTWLARTAVGGQRPACVTLLHLDEHDDLMTPRLVDAGGYWQDAITGAAIDLEQPATIAAAIRSGAISIGNFIAPLVHWLPELHIRHLRQSPGAPPVSSVRQLHPAWQADTLLAPGSARPALQLSEHQAKDGVPGQHTYLCTTDTVDWLANLPPGPVLLHIDLDYFNNRYAGDPDWYRTAPDFDPPLGVVLRRIDEVFAALEAAGLVHRIASYTVAMSPGFFPASMWAASAHRVMAHIHRLRTLPIHR